MRKELGKITKAEFGFCGYNDIYLGLFVTFEFKGGGCCTNITWLSTDWDQHCKWSKDEQKMGFGDVALQVRDILRKAKIRDVSELVGVPVEMTFDGMELKDWRILEEVL